MKVTIKTEHKTCCAKMKNAINDGAIKLIDLSDEAWLSVGGMGHYKINLCPFCGESVDVYYDIAFTD